MSTAEIIPYSIGLFTGFALCAVVVAVVKIKWLVMKIKKEHEEWKLTKTK